MMSAPLPTVSRTLLPNLYELDLWKNQKMELILEPLRGFPRCIFSIHPADEPLQLVHKPGMHSSFQNKRLQVFPVGDKCLSSFVSTLRIRPPPPPPSHCGELFASSPLFAPSNDPPPLTRRMWLRRNSLTSHPRYCRGNRSDG